MITVSAIVKLFLQATETFIPTAGDVTSNGSQITHDGFNVNPGTLNPSSTPPATLCAYFRQALAAGVATIDLTSLQGTFATVTGNGLKVRAVLFEALAGNAGAITVQPGASNPHSCFGAASKFTLAPGCATEFWLNDSDSAVSPTSKGWDLSGTGTDALNVAVLFG